MKIGFSSFTLINNRQTTPPNKAAPLNQGMPLTSATTRVKQQSIALAPEPSTADDPFTKRIKKQQEAFESLASLPSSKELSQQRASEKVGSLRQRIEMLKAMMRFASPERLKSIAKELKSVANQLASAAKLLGSQGVGMTATPSVMQPAAAQQAVDSAGGADPAASQASSDGGNQADVKTAEDDAKRAVEQTAEDNAAGFVKDFVKDDTVVLLPNLPDITQQNNDSRATSTGSSASEHALRSILTEAQKELREAANELKVRLREEDKEARRELKKAEEAMEKTDQAIATSTSDALYSSLGQLLPASDVSVSITPTINVEV
ncbi:hypothetical protein [Vreelandella nigrificans]|uniref:Uncharacterized protein n=1 Tax=Vreelandella nigrificans TaxID=2042704 RepID=A0A2A4HMR3_9GAMM|nr:hypothetical protein [Halomonas nigrificans]PCF95393.1 hypothetical protein CPA45_12735 [Halomonas nigrificans]